MTRERRNHAEDAWKDWGNYMNAKIHKLEKQYEDDLKIFNENNKAISTIFKGIAIFVNGYTEPPADILRQLMLAHGGIFHHYYTKSHTTHIIASNLAATKFKQLTSEKVVRPEWILESIKAKKLLPYHQYLLHNPLVQQKTLKFVNEAKEKSISEQSHNKHSIPDQPPSPQKHLAIASTSSERTTLSAKDPQFLSEFYSHSRLHLISSMSAEFKNFVCRLQDKTEVNFQGRERLRLKLRERTLPSTENHNSHSAEIESSNQTVSKVIMHIDMDCFFVSVGLRTKPELKGKPVAVTHSKATSIGSHHNSASREFEVAYYKNKYKKESNNGKFIDPFMESAIAEELYINESDDENVKNVESLNASKSSAEGEESYGSSSEIACCSYEARQAGIRNGMFLGEALKLCPTLKTLPYDFEGYQEVAYVLYNTIASYTHTIEAVSCDELYVDCTDIINEMKIEPLFLSSVIREEIAEKTGCTCSAGLGPNLLLARLATKKAKPNGQFIVDSSSSEEFISPFSVKELPGIGWSLRSKLEDFGISTCEEMRNKSLQFLQSEFGPKTGQMLYNFCRGIDERPINSEHQRKSVSAEVNYGIRFTQKSEALQFLNELSGEVSKRLEKTGMKGKVITLKMKIRKKEAPIETFKFMGHGVCDNISRSSSLNIPTKNCEIIKKEVEKLFQSLNVSPSEIRGMGIQINKLCSNNNSPEEQSLVGFLEKMEKNSKSHEAKHSNSSHSMKRLNEDFPSSFSEIDQDVMAALPVEIQEELVNAYKRPTRSTSNSPNKRTVSSISPNKRTTSSNSPNKRSTSSNSPNKRSTTSNSPNKRSTSSYSPSKRRAKNSCKGKKTQPKATTDLTDFVQNKPVENVVAPEPKQLHATFCGVENLPEVKSLIQEWIDTCAEPQMDDSDIVSDYLKALILEKNLERVDVLVRFLNRLIQKKNNALWEFSYQHITSQVQEFVINIYGVPLKLP